MSYIRIKSRREKNTENKKPKRGVSKLEYDITKFLLDYMNVDIDSDYTILYNYTPIIMRKRYLAFPHYYLSLKFLGKDQELFRPLRHDSHANVLIEMFTKSYSKHMDHFEYETSDMKGFNGWFVSNGERIRKSTIFNIPSIPILKCASIARTLMTKEDYKFFMGKIMFHIADSEGDKNDNTY